MANEAKVFTVICSYLKQAGIRQEARIFYDCTPARTVALAVAKVAAKCPATPTDIVVFEGELYDTGFEPRTGSD